MNDKISDNLSLTYLNGIFNNYHNAAIKGNQTFLLLFKSFNYSRHYSYLRLKIIIHFSIFMSQNNLSLSNFTNNKKNINIKNKLLLIA